MIARVKQLIEATHGRIFSIKFVKRDGTLRHMVCRTELLSSNGSTSLIQQATNTYRVLDMRIREWRTINLDTVREFKFKGEVVRWIH